MTAPQPLVISDFPLAGSCLIEASAGTGKTFTIALLYVRLVLGHQPDSRWPGAGLMPPDILVVTFTEAATLELRDRIRARLAQAAECFELPAGALGRFAEGDPLIELRDSLDPESWPACVRRLQLASEWMDESAVSTIHSWCNRMLSEHAFESGHFFSQALATNLSDLQAEVVRDYWRTFVYLLAPAAAELYISLWREPEALRGPALAVADQLGAIKEAPQPPAQALADLIEALQHLKQRWRDSAEALATRMDAAIEAKAVNGKKLRRDWWQSWLTLLNDWAASHSSLVPALSESARNRLTRDGMAEVFKPDSAFADLAEHEAWHLIGESVALNDRLEPARAAMLVHAAQWIAQRLETEKQRFAQMDFNDLLQHLDAALQSDRGDMLAGLIRRQFPVALIDEFQDTDPLQYRIFDRIYRLADNDPRRSLILIGDPKQAIYRFRGADIFTYLQAKADTGGRHYSLARNFRSTLGQVEGVNHLFTQADQRLGRGAFMFRREPHAQSVNPLPFVPVAAAGRSDRWQIDGEPAPALTFWSWDADKAEPKGESDRRLAEACASEVVRLLLLGQQAAAGFVDESGMRSVMASDIAVLVNKRAEAALVRDALHTRGVRTVYLSDREVVLDSPVAGDIERWLQACAEPEQLPLLRAALATPTLGQTDQRLAQLLSDEIALDEEIDRFRGYRQLWQQRGVLPMLRRLIGDFDVPARLLSDARERDLTDLLHLAELLQQESQQLDGEHALIRHFADLRVRGDAGNDWLQVRLESDARLVRVITVHKSKGLEYPLVFVPFGCSYRSEDSKQTMIQWHDEQGQLQVSLASHPEALRQADDERLGEDIRKLYVALTRARYATWVGAAPIRQWHRSGLGYLLGDASGSEPDDADEHYALASTLKNRLDDSPHIQVLPPPEGADQRLSHSETMNLGPALAPPPPRDDNWWIASYSALRYEASQAADQAPHQLRVQPEAGDSLQEETAREETVAGGPTSRPGRSSADTTDSPLAQVAAFPAGPGPGVFLHGLLEWAGQQGFALLADRPELFFAEIDRQCQARGWEAWTELLKAWGLRMLTVPLPLPPHGLIAHTCALSHLKVYQTELEFWFASHQVSIARLDELARKAFPDRPGDKPRPSTTPGQLNGMLKGFIDLVFEYEGRYYILDYKSNRLGDVADDYGPEALRANLLSSRYDLQYLLYLLALHRLLKSRLPDYEVSQHLGGGLYFYLRGTEAPGQGVFCDCPQPEVIEALDRLFSGADQIAQEPTS